jgi:histone acetyltransferase (RNA polymerase elongator complex component)
MDNIIISYIDSQIKKFGSIHKKYKKKQISFYGGSFTCLEQKIMEQYLKKGFVFIKNGTIDSLRLSTRPDCIDLETLNLLKKYGVESIELGVQTLDNNLLNILNRGHSVRHVIESSDLIKSKGFELGIQLMVGLPGENDKIIDKNIDILITKIKPKFIRIYPLIVLKGTKLEIMYNNEEFFPLNIKETILRCKKIVEKCYENNIEVIRIGLQSTETLKKNIVSGNFPDNLGQLVRDSIKMEEIL